MSCSDLSHDILMAVFQFLTVCLLCLVMPASTKEECLEPGIYLEAANNGYCALCPAGFFCPEASSTKIACPAGIFIQFLLGLQSNTI